MSLNRTKLNGGKNLKAKSTVAVGYSYTNRPIYSRKKESFESTLSNVPVYAHQILPDECPLNRDNLGQIGWALLHTICAHYPDHPSAEEKYAMAQFIFLFGRFYPCRMCGEHFLEEINKNPPEVNNNYTLNKWICKAHNFVNQKLGKPIYDCNRVLERWRLGWADGSCIQPSRRVINTMNTLY